MALSSRKKRGQVNSDFPVDDLNEFQSATNKVFSNDELRQIILDMVLGNPKEVGVLDSSAICTLRLLNSSWLRSVTKALKKVNQPLFTVNLISSSDQLEEFVGTVPTSSRIHSPAPPFSMKIESDFVCEGVQNCFPVRFIRCGSGLLELKIMAPEFGGFFIPRFTDPINLPLLRNFEVHLLFEHGVYSALDEVTTGIENFLRFFHFILSSAGTLETLSINSTFPSHLGKLRRSFKLDRLPSSLKQLVIGYPAQPEELQGLLESQLPNLVALELTVPNSLPKELLAQILDHFRKTLETLKIKGLKYQGPFVYITWLQLPILENLKTLEMSSTSVQLNGDPSSLQNCLPKLKNLQLTNHCSQMLRKWTADSKYCGVEELRVGLVDELFKLNPNPIIFQEVMNLETMRIIQRSFPNLKGLALDVSVKTVGRTPDVAFLFPDMTHLRSLRLQLVYSLVDNVGEDSFDRFLTGLPSPIIDAFKAHPECWSQMEIKSGLAKFKELEQFSLEIVRFFEEEEELNLDLAFNLVFMKMANLKDVRLMNGFKVSTATRKEWEEVLHRKLSIN